MDKPIPVNASGRPAFGRRKVVAASPDAGVTTGFMSDDCRIPLVVQPATDGMDLCRWAESNHAQVEEWLARHSSLLFRGFQVRTADQFAEFVRINSKGDLLEYRDRSTPRESRGDKIYTSTVYPAKERINLHNEGTYWTRWALKIYFCCLKAPLSGGETPIADIRGVYRRIDPEIRERFIRKQILYVRNYNDGFGLPWQDVFQCADRADVEQYCIANRIEYEWKSNDRLRTRQRRPAVRTHPRTGEPLWFNHGAFFHVTSLEPKIRDLLLRDLGEDNLPYNTYYGDGSAIDPDHVAHILDAYRAEQVLFQWREGDVLLQDNMAIAHAREPYTGAREVLAAMAVPYSGEAD